MALLPVTLRRRLRSSGFTEEQTEAIEEAVEAGRSGLAGQQRTDDQFEALRRDIENLRIEMQALKWWLFGALSTVILAATGAIIAAIAVWG